MESLPSWALEVMLACAMNASKTDFASEIEDAIAQHLFRGGGDEKAWYSSYPLVEMAKARDLSQSEFWLSVSAQKIDAVFGEDGDLAQVYANYEPRPGQTALAHTILKALNEKTFLLAEAGTGVGKSLAYLVPAALWACTNNMPIVISTNTRNLQSQLLTKDIPLVQKIIRDHLPPGVSCRATVLKGRGNYLCLKQFGAYLEGAFEALPENEALLFADLVAWAATTIDGDLERFRPTHARGDMGFLHTFSCGGVECPGKKCRHYRRCFLLRARQQAIQAHLVIVNHALVFADLVSAGKLLPPHQQIIFDEAHNIENVATGCLSQTLSPLTLYLLCQRVAPSAGREAGSILHHARVDFIDRAVSNPAERSRLLQALADLRSLGQKLAKQGKALFSALYTSVMTKTPESAVRYRSVADQSLPQNPDGSAQLRRELCLSTENFVPAETFLPKATVQEHEDVVKQTIYEIERQLNLLEASIKSLSPPDMTEGPFAELLSSISIVRSGFDEFASSLTSLLEGAHQHTVYWMETLSEGDRTVSLNAAPLDISLQLNELLYKHRASVIFSSATLRIRNQFDHIRRRLGLSFIARERPVPEFIAESPFNYPQQCCVAVPDYLPEVTNKDANYELELARLMYSLFCVAKGRSLALFTSYEMMKRCAELMQKHLEDRGIDLLVQSANMSRDAITEIFREQTRPTVIFGTQSFWEGVDVVGDALSCVVIARLPFDVVNDPLNVARSEKIRAEGGTPFAELTLPQAVIKFRQGFGRLIRSRADRGMVVVADSRIVRKSYGSLFANSLPCRIEAFHSRQAIVKRLQHLIQPPTP